MRARRSPFDRRYSSPSAIHDGPPQSPTPHGLFRLALRAVHRANGVARLEGAAPPPPFWPTYCPRLLFGAPVGSAKPVVFLRRHLRCPYFAAHHGDRYRTLACLSGPASHPVSQSKCWSCYYAFVAFVLMSLIANGALNAAALAFYDILSQDAKRSCRRRFGTFAHHGPLRASATDTRRRADACLLLCSCENRVL